MANQFFQKMRENNPDLPSKIGAPWTTDEEKKLLQLLADGKSHQEIGVILERTKGGISGRVKLIACKMFDNSTSTEDIMRITCLTKDELEEAIKKHTSSKVEKVKSVEEKVFKKEQVQSKLITPPQSDIMEMKLLMFEIRDLLKKIADKN
jgi:hypothetical protein